MVFFERLETDLADHCNMACAQCSRQSSYARPGFYDLNQFERDIAVLSQHAHVAHFAFVGGEPLLNPDVSRYMEISQKHGFCDDFHLLTNGTLLPSTDMGLLCSFASILVGVYPGSRRDEVLGYAENLKQALGNRVEIKLSDTFNICNLTKENFIPELVRQIWEDCVNRVKCPAVYKGYFLKCIMSYKKKEYLNQKGKGAYVLNEEDLCPIHRENFGERFLRLVNRTSPLGACQWCLGTSGREVASYQKAKDTTYDETHAWDLVRKKYSKAWDREFLIHMLPCAGRLSVLDELNTVDINPTVIPAETGASAEAGCRLSHLKILKLARELNISPLIIEDDVMMAEPFKRISGYLPALGRLAWDMLFFYSDRRFSETIPDSPLLSGATYCTHFYLVNKDSLDKVIRLVEANPDMPIDHAYLKGSRSGDLDVFCTPENLVCQNIGFPSTIPGGDHVQFQGKMNGIFQRKPVGRAKPAGLWGRAYLINLVKRPDRLESSLAELGRVGITPLILSAVESPLGPETGCRLSQLAIMKMAKAENVTPLIIEDDILVQDAYKKLPQYAEALKTVPWDIFFFYSDRLLTKEVLGSPLLSGPTFCCHFYIINVSSLGKVIQMVESANDGLDRIIISQAKAGNLNCYCADENMVCQDADSPNNIIGWDHVHHDGQLNGIFQSGKYFK